ncbi:MAG: HAD family phosphatase [Ruminococcaceae bacterium]|nr:HAD family phosphatase [Oscillospiraceae bacterium]
MIIDRIKKIDGAIFDLDGTVLDSMHIWSEIGLLFLKNKGIEPPPGVEDEFVKMSMVQAAEYYIKNIDPKATVTEIVNEVNALVQDFYFNEVIKKNSVTEFLDFLKNKGVKMCIATATDKHLVKKALERNGLLDYFTEIFTCSGVGAGKDTPVIYNVALEHLGTNKETTYVFEDALYAIETAKKAGYKIIGISDVSEKASPEEIKKLCDYYVNDYTEIYNCFE